MSGLQITVSLTSQVWKQLQRGQVPIITRVNLADVLRDVKDLNQKLRSHAYVPDIGHGYLGLEKNSGVTRFIPILTKEDMTVYYHLCGQIGQSVIESVPNVYGGWRSIPTHYAPLNSKDRLTERSAKEYQGGYYSGSFSSSAWFFEYRGYINSINEIRKNRKYRFVLKSDVANFYDSIDLGLLTSKLRQDAPGLSSEIELLEMFLSNWNRRTTGYQNSTRGIPQEIISDGSRNLSHYYLQEFDKRIIEYTKANNQEYIRWADDILLFGNSIVALEKAAHNCSKFLMRYGLNLNSSKTRIYTLSDYARYRCLNVLEAIERKDQQYFRREIRKIQKLPDLESIKFETVFRASIGFISDLGKKIGSFERNFLQESLERNPKIVGELNTRQLYRLIASADSPTHMYQSVKQIALKTEITGPKANFLMLIRDDNYRLSRLGIKVSTMRDNVASIQSGTDSEIIHRFCGPAAMQRLPNRK